ncbi:MAG: AbrB/MazE/SpoVT family DNA-binding domain-containing protein [Bifidobacteriaceae bacterium]|jgi:AbrB family looped-hinge helix DNA binding protein|nr:AbrB/MazE/SpoVT family DNA-binding domain-containing protein [Bifidobacteriaceae bacterium]
MNPATERLSSPHHRVRVSTNGRIVLPQPVRQARGWRDGDELLLIETAEGMMIGKPAEVLHAIQARFRGPTSVTDELIAERRAQAAQDAA